MHKPVNGTAKNILDDINAINNDTTICYGGLRIVVETDTHCILQVARFVGRVANPFIVHSASRPYRILNEEYTVLCLYNIITRNASPISRRDYILKWLPDQLHLVE